MTVNNDICPSAVGSVSGIIAFGSGLGAVLFTNLVGHLVQGHPYIILFGVIGFLHPVGYLIFKFMLKGEQSCVPGHGPQRSELESDGYSRSSPAPRSQDCEHRLMDRRVAVLVHGHLVIGTPEHFDPYAHRSE